MNINRKSISRLQILILVLVSVHGVNQSWSQEYKYEIGGRLGTLYYSGDVSNQGVFSPHGLLLGAEVRSNPSLRWSLMSSLLFGHITGESQYSGSVLPLRQNMGFVTNIINLRLGGEYHWWALSDKYRYLSTRSWSPYLGGGIGAVFAWGDESQVFAPSLYASVGIKYKLNSRWTASAEWTWQYTLTDRLDALSGGGALLSNPYGLNTSLLKGNDAIGGISIGLSYLFGRRNDLICD